jgi:uncharacterized protein (TIGR03435 family)
VAVAYHVDPMDVSGPDWIAYMGAPVYEVNAVMPPDTSRHDFELMLRSLLTEQFELKLHHEPRLFPAYELSVAAGGPRLRHSEKAEVDEAPLGRPKIGPDKFPVMPPGHGQRVSMIDGFHARFQNYGMAEFAEHLSDYITPDGEKRRIVIDKTGLTGVFDFTLEFDPVDVRVTVAARNQSSGSAHAESQPGSGLPDVFKALERQLGLKLTKSGNIQKDTIVIDHARKTPLGN